MALLITSLPPCGGGFFLISLPPCGGGLGWGVSICKRFTPHPDPPPQGGRGSYRSEVANVRTDSHPLPGEWTARHPGARRSGRSFRPAISIARGQGIRGPVPL